MKNFILAATLLLLGNVVVAQNAMRLIGYANYIPQISEIDSGTYTYTGSNGGSSNHPIKYTTFNSYTSLNNNSYGNDALLTQTFDAHDNISTLIQQFWDGYHNTFINGSKDIYTYNAANLRIADTTQQWDTLTNQWDNIIATIYEFNANNLDTANILQEWQTNAWVNYGKYTYTYDANSNNTEFEQWNWVSGVWVPTTLTSTTFDSHNNMLTSLYAQWASGKWDTLGDVSINSYYYNGNGLATESVISALDPATKVTDTSALELFTYDNNNNLSARIYENYGNFIFTKADSNTYRYDVNNNQILNEAFERILGSWDSISKITQQFNQYSQLTYYNGGNFTGATYKPTEVSYYYYQPYTAGINQLAVNSNQLTVYPNPSTGLVTITSTQNISDVTVINLVGQLILAQPALLSLGEGQGVRQLDLSTYPAGMYFITVKTGDETETSKIVIAH